MSREANGGPEGFGRTTRRSGKGREAHPKVREAHPEIRDRSRIPPKRPGRIGSPT